MAARRKARALTRKITRNEALSYERSVPNPLGVTHIAEINGRDAYRRRYRATVELLGSRGGKMRKRGRRRMRRNFEGAGSFTPRGTPLHELAGQVARAQRKGKRRRPAAAAGTRKRRKRIGASKRRSAPRKRKLTKAERAAISRRNLRKAHAALGRGKRKRTKAKKRRKAPARRRSVARTRPLYARIGGVKRRTYLTRGKKGRTRRMSTHAILGYPTSAALKKAMKKGSKSLGRRMESVRRKRSSAAARASKQILEGRGLYSMFTPNRAGGDVVSYEEWKKMKPNKAAKKRKKKTARRGKRRQTAAQKRASLRNLAKARRARKSGGTKRRRKGARRSKRGKLTKAQRRAISIRNLAKARRAKAGKKGGARKRRRKATRRKSVTIRMVANKRRSGRRKATRKRRRRSGLRSRSVTLYASNRRRRRSYRRNFGLGNFVQSLKSAVKIGAVAAVGFGLHRTLTRLLDQYALSRVPQLQTGKLAEVRPMLAGALVIMGGNALVSKLAPRYAGVIGGGMAVSFMVDAIVRVLTMVGQPNIAGYFSGYADAGGRAYSGLSSYYNYHPGETFNGYGEFYQPMNGMGQLEQAAAGYGQLQQAAAGYGYPALQQAAAGIGEYTAYGAQAIGEYEETPYSGYGAEPHLELAPNLSEAEQALTIAEAAAGLGSYGDIPGRMTVEPSMMGSPVPDEPGGSRAGVMAGRDGIFG